MKKRTLGMIVGSTALLSAGTAVAIKSAKKKADSGPTGSSGMLQEVKNGADEAVEKIQTTMDKQHDAEAEKQRNNENTKSSLQPNGESTSSNVHHGDVSPEDLRKKEKMPSPDADEVEAEKGLDVLDHQHRAEWQANVFPATEEEVEALEEAGKGESGKTQSEQARELERQNMNQHQPQKQTRNKNRNRNRNRNQGRTQKQNQK